MAIEAISRPGTSTHERLSIAAIEIFEEMGFDTRVTGCHCPHAPGVSEWTFFRHFESKEMSLFADRDVIRSQFPEMPTGRDGALPAFRAALIALVDARAEQLDLWRRRYAVIDATPKLVAFDRALDVDLIDGIAAHIIGPLESATPIEVVLGRSIAASMTVGASYVMRAVANGEAAEPLIDAPGRKLRPNLVLGLAGRRYTRQ